MRNRQKPRSLKRTSRGVTRSKGRALRVSEARHRLRYPEEALHESEERFRSVAERSYDAITVTDSEGRFTFVSPSIERIVGYRPEELVGVQFRGLVPESEMPKVVRAFNRTMKGENVEGLQLEVKRKDGSLVHIEVNGSPILKDGQVLGMQGILRDITEHKRMEEELRSTKERLEYVVTSNPAAIYSGKPFADLSDWELTYLSENVAGILGHEAWEFVGHPKFWARIVHPKDRPSVLAEIPRLWGKGRNTIEYRMRHKNGDYRWIREEANVVRDATGKPIEVNGYWIDITERKRMEDALLKSQRMAAIGETTAMVGHDLRNPLQAMTGALYLAKKLSRSERVEGRKEAVELLDTIDDQILYMDKIVSDLQSYAGPVEAEPVETNLPNLVREVISNAHVPGNVETHVEVQEDLTRVMVDRTLLQRVLANLITNAVQAMPKGGNVTVTAHKEKESVTITVEDTGEGIARENMDKIFTPFFTTKAKGQGLGLPVCKRLVEAQDGTITATSEVGKGSTFILKIPTSSVSGAV